MSAVKLTFRIESYKAVPQCSIRTRPHQYHQENLDRIYDNGFSEVISYSQRLITFNI